MWHHFNKPFIIRAVIICVLLNVALWICGAYLNTFDLAGGETLLNIAIVLNYPAALVNSVVYFGDEKGIISFIIYSLLQSILFGFFLGLLLQRVLGPKDADGKIG